MKKLGFLLLIVPFFLMGQDDSSSINNVTHIEVKIGHEAQFVEGVKMYNKCYSDNSGDAKWNFWRQVQGTNTVYAVTDMMENWAEMDDENDEARNKCRNLFPDFVLPHIKETNYMITETMPDISNDSTEPKDKVWVTYFRVKNTVDFMSVIKAISGEIKKAEGDERAYWYSVVGGSTESADYMVAWTFDKYADLDKDMDGVWQIYENVHGKKKTEEMRTKFRNSLDNSWGYIYDKSDDMSKTD
ncbi:hypothetical protein [Winogradskyella sp. UBA3174]|uniref:hypothetical protein n=1 Tax=Winogradskyella sp. UBA3174 TaxID=1947785 RepID=UPI0025F08731|nr:hypothetical protein [Winogradskyella sp. UBA3174]|tara:strand:+ start:64228 stop:64956 length:729 start_codon:yes stop_codon:yes gene_type:complete